MVPLSEHWQVFTSRNDSLVRRQANLDNESKLVASKAAPHLLISACYSQPLQQTLQTMTLISEVAHWSKRNDASFDLDASRNDFSFDFYERSNPDSPKSNHERSKVQGEKLPKGTRDVATEKLNISLTREFLAWESNERSGPKVSGSNDRCGDHFSDTQFLNCKRAIEELVEMWEEPESKVNVSVRAVITSDIDVFVH